MISKSICKCTQRGKQQKLLQSFLFRQSNETQDQQFDNSSIPRFNIVIRYKMVGIMPSIYTKIYNLTQYMHVFKRNGQQPVSLYNPQIKCHYIYFLNRLFLLFLISLDQQIQQKMRAQQQKQSNFQLCHPIIQSIETSKENKQQQTAQFEEGFAQEDEGIASIIPKRQVLNNEQISPEKKKILQYRFQQPKLSKVFFISKELTFISNDRESKQILRRSMRNQQTIERQGQNNRSVNFKKKNQQPFNILQSCVIKITRNFVGQNLSNFNYSCQQTKRIKYHILTSGAKLVYEFFRESSTHGYLSMLLKNSKKQKSQSFFFLESNNSSIGNQKKSVLTSMNSSNSILSQSPHQKKNNCLDIQKVNDLIKGKIKQTPYNYQNIKNYKTQLNSPSKAQLIFDGQFESANIQFVSRKSQFDRSYDIFLRNDTNTKGHQNWFNFRVKNNIEKSVNQLGQIQNSTKFTFNIMNLKRFLQLVEIGQKIYIKKMSSRKLSQKFILHEQNQWILSGQNFEIKQCKELDFYKSKIYKLSFTIQLQNQAEYQISLLPSYTYSQMLKEVKQIQRKNLSHAKVQILTYSLVGLAIPILTFTSNNDDANKEVILISGRIHPGQTVASYMLKGLINKLIDNTNKETKQFLDNNIIKIIPMINPDGVVFGNFRTNYLGYDLNRSFSVEGIQNEQVILPQVCALKQLGKKLKLLYADRFSSFIDMHGHSAQKNIFTYGPDYDIGHQNFYKARLLPKLLNTKSQYFKYNSCTFKLQQYKSCTARGFFINKLGVSAYTIEGSYGIYQTEEGLCKALSHIQWMKFGKQLGQSFQLMSRLNKTYSIKNRSQLKKVISMSQEQQIQLLKKLKKDIKKQQVLSKKQQKFFKKQLAKVPIQDSDGEDQLQDISNIERLDIQKKMLENNKLNNLILPKVFKPSVLYPTVPPKLFNIGEGTTGSYKILYTRRNRYHSIKMPNSQYLHSFQGLDLLKLNTRKLQKKSQLF